MEPGLTMKILDRFCAAHRSGHGHERIRDVAARHVKILSVGAEADWHDRLFTFYRGQRGGDRPICRAAQDFRMFAIKIDKPWSDCSLELGLQIASKGNQFAAAA